MTTQLMNTLNNLFSQDSNAIMELKKYLHNKRTYDNEEYAQKFATKPIYKQFALKKQQLIYKPSNLIVLEDDAQKRKILDEMFSDDSNTFGKGINQFYKYACTKYIGIKRNDVKEYLQSKGEYQMTQNMAKRINKPIIADHVNDMWCIDLVDMNSLVKHNRGWRYIVVVVDVFSRHVFLSKLKHKEAADTTAALRGIINRNGIAPDHLLSDNGTEWLGDFQQFCTENNIKQHFTRSYSPEANGVVERMNKEIRKIMHAFFVRNHNKVWYNIIDKIGDNKNSSYNSSVGNAPADIWTAEKDEQRMLPTDAKYKARAELVKRGKRKLEQFKEEDNLQVGQLVRVKMSSIFANIRKLVKDKNTKQIVVSYTPELFVVNRVIIPRTGVLERKRYMLENEDGVLLSKNGKPQMFYASELLLYTGKDASDVDMDMDTALKLNGVTKNANDVDY